MIALVKSEAFKLRTLRSTWLVVAVAVALSAAIGVVLVRVGTSTGLSLTVAQVGAAPVQALWFLSAAIAVVASAGEFQHRTIRTTLLIAPRRPRVLLAKALVSGGFGAALVAVGAAASTAAGLISGPTVHAVLPGGDARQWGGLAASVGLGALWSMIAAAMGVLTRSTAIAISALLLWRFVVEGILPGLTGHAEQVARWTPLGAGNAMIGVPDLLPVWVAATVFLGYLVVVGGAATAVFVRRDPA